MRRELRIGVVLSLGMCFLASAGRGQPAQASATSTSTAAPPAVVTAEDTSPEREAAVLRSQVRIQHFEALFAAEAPDLEWSLQTRGALEAGWRSGVTGPELETIECRSSLCRIVFRFATEEQQPKIRAWLHSQRCAFLLPGAPGRYTGRDGYGRQLVFMQCRELPGVQP